MCLLNILMHRKVKFDGVPKRVVRRWKICKVHRVRDIIQSVRPAFVWGKPITKEWLKSWFSRSEQLGTIRDKEYIAGFHVFIKKKDALAFKQSCSALYWANSLEIVQVECAGLLASGNERRSQYYFPGDKHREEGKKGHQEKVIEVYQYIRLRSK